MLHAGWPITNMESYNLYLYHQRIERKLKRRDFAHFLHVNSFLYKRIEQGYIKPTKKQIAKISTALDVDYAPYLEGDYSYPIPLPERPEGKWSKRFYAFCGKLWVRLTLVFLMLCSGAVLGTGIYYGNEYKSNPGAYYSDEYVVFFNALTEKGTTTITLTGDLTRPEISSQEEGKFYSIKGSYTKTALSSVSNIATYHTDEYRISYSFSYNSPVMLSVHYVPYETGTTYSLTYYETSKDVYEYSYFLDSSSLIDSETAEGKAQIEAIKAIASLHFSELNTNFTTLIRDKLSLNYSFYDKLIPDYKAGSKQINTISIISLFLIILGTIGLAGNLFFLSFCYIYGRKRNQSVFQKETINTESLGREPHAKKDIFFSPFLPETFFELIGILFVFFGSLRILYYFFTFVGAITISGNDFTVIPETLFYLFMIGMFLLYFMDFDIFLDDKRVFRNVIMYFLIFICLYVLESMLMAGIAKSDILVVKEIGSKLSVPNNFGTICCYFLMMLTLFYTPKQIKSHKWLVFYRWLTAIPIAIIVVNTLIYHYANTEWGWNLPIKILYLFASEKTQFSLLCIIYLLGLFFLKYRYEMKYGKEKALALMGGNRFIFLKNSIAALTVLVIGLVEIIFYKNTAAHELGLGKYPYIIILAPFLLFYHPHKGGRNQTLDWTTMILYVIAFAGGYILIAVPFIIILFMALKV